MQKQPSIQRIETDRFEMEYFTFGEGERDLVLIPGVSVRPIVYSVKAVELAYADMADDFRITCIDRKKDIESGYSVDDMAEDTAEVMHRIGLQKANVLGCSQGGMIAAMIAMKHPELIGKLVLASTLARGNAMSDRAFERWLYLSEQDDRQALNRDIAQRVYSDAYRKRYSRLFALMEQSGTPEEILRFRRLVEACRGFDIYEQLGKITCPVMVVGSEKDRVVGKVGPTEIAEKLHCPFVLYDGYSHAVYDEAPDLHKRLTEFLREA